MAERQLVENDAYVSSPARREAFTFWFRFAFGTQRLCGGGTQRGHNNFAIRFDPFPFS